MKIFKWKRWMISSVVASATSLGGVEVASAESVPRGISHEGRLTDMKGSPHTGLKRATLRLYDARVGGPVRWSETVEVEFDDGYFSVLLGESTPIDDSFLDGTTRWLGVTVGAGAERTSRVAVVGLLPANSAEDGALRAPGTLPRPTVPAAPLRPTGVVIAAAHADAALGPLVTTADLAFIGATMPMTVEAGQIVLVSARAGLGSTSRGGADSLLLSICSRPSGSTRLIDNRADRLENLRVGENIRQTFAVRTRFGGLIAGEYEFGLCGHVKGVASRWNHNDSSRVTVLVTAP